MVAPAFARSASVSRRQIRRAVVSLYEQLEFRRLMSATIDISNVLAVAQDQPVIHAILKTSPNGSPLIGNDTSGTFGTYDVQGYLDTGSSGVQLSTATTDPSSFNIPEAIYNGQHVTYNDTGIAGSTGTGVSAPLTIGLAPANASNISDILTSNPPPSLSEYTQSFNGIRAQLSRDPNAAFDIFGMPVLQGKVMVIDPKPVQSGGSNLSTYIYNPGTAYNAGTADTNPGIPSTNIHIKMSYASFSNFETVTPTGAIGPNEYANPFIGPNPVTALLPHAPVDNTPAIQMSLGSDSTSGSFLFDSGAGASFISQAKAGDLGVSYFPGTYNTDFATLVDSDGFPLPDQFTAQISGVGGAVTVAGFYMDSMTIPTMEGPPLRILHAPVLVTDVTVTDQVTHQQLTLDGDFGMNYLVPSFSADLTDKSNGNFDWVTFDQPNGILGVDLPGVTVNPWPTAAISTGNVLSTGGSNYTFNVTYTPPTGASITAGSISNANIIVTGPHGFSQPATLVTQVLNGNGSRTATYHITPPSGSWTIGADGDYSVVLQSNQVTDSLADPVAAGTLGTFSVAIAPASIPNTAGTDTYYVMKDPNSIFTEMWVNTPTGSDPTYLFAKNTFSPLSISGGGGSDSLTVDYGWGNPLSTGGAVFDGGTGTNTLTILGSDNGDTFTIDNQFVNWDVTPISYSNTQTITINGGQGNDSLEQTAQPTAAVNFTGTGADSLLVDAGTFTFTADPAVKNSSLSVFDYSNVVFNPASVTGITAVQLAGLTLGPNSTATVVNAGSATTRSVLDLGALALGATSKLDLGRNDMIVRNANLASIITQLRNGLNLSQHGYWNGKGIVSSSAAGDPNFTTAIGVLLNVNKFGDPLMPSFDGQGVFTTDVLLKYTYFGDADLSGKVDGTDYSLTDFGFTAKLTGWTNGDFNYDGVVNGSDYSLLDNTFNRQGTALAATPAAMIAVHSEPTVTTSTNMANPFAAGPSAIDWSKQKKRPELLAPLL